MRNNIKFEGKYLLIDDIRFKFSHEIRDVQQASDKIFVLLSIPYNDNSLDNIFSVSYSGKILWKVQSLAEIYPSQLNLPYEQMILEENEIRAIDFYGRRSFINADNGQIYKRDVVK